MVGTKSAVLEEKNSTGAMNTFEGLKFAAWFTSGTKGNALICDSLGEPWETWRSESRALKNELSS